MDAHKQSLGLFFFSSDKGDILGRRYTVLESFSDYLPFRLLSCFTALGQFPIASHLWLKDVLQLATSKCDAEYALQAQKVREFWNHIIKKGCEAEGEQLRRTGVNQY